MSTKSILFTLLAAIALYFIFSLNIVVPLRTFINSSLVIPLRELSGYVPKTSQQKLAQTKVTLESKNREIAQLKQENKTMRKQLGSIPEKTALTPVTVIGSTDTELFVSSKNTFSRSIVGAPVILEDVFVGTVLRKSENMFVIQKPLSAHFTGEGETAGGVTGKVRGEFNESVVFETGVEEAVSVGELVYLVNREQGFRAVLGKVVRIEKNARLPTKKAYVEYTPDRIKLRTVFLVL